MAQITMDALMEKNKNKILRALYSYYTKKVTLQRAAQDEGVPVRLVIQARNEYHLPIVFSDRDVETGKDRIRILIKAEHVKLP